MRRLDGIALLNVDLNITSQFQFNFKVLVNAFLYGQINRLQNFGDPKALQIDSLLKRKF